MIKRKYKLKWEVVTMQMKLNVAVINCTQEGPYPVATSHILIVLSLEEETTKSPPGMKVTLDTLWS